MGHSKFSLKERYMKRKILIQVNCSYDLYTYIALINKNFNHYEISLLAPKLLINKVDHYFLDKFHNIFQYDQNLKSLISISALISTIKLSIWCFFNKNNFYAILVGAYRNEITSILAKHFSKTSKLIAIKQGIDINENKYKDFKNLYTFHDYIYFKIFGFSYFKRSRLKPLSKSPHKNDYFFSILKWKRNPFEFKNIYTIGTNNASLKDGTKLILPDFRFINKNSLEVNNSILIIGERTPMTPYWDEHQDIKLKRILLKIKKYYPNTKIFLRPRLKLTRIDYYEYLKPLILNPKQLFDEQINKIKPKLVISVKSTASKVAAYYGYNSILLYKCLNLKKKELLHLNYLFADGSPVKLIENESKIKTEILNENSEFYYKENKYFNFDDFF